MTPRIIAACFATAFLMSGVTTAEQQPASNLTPRGCSFASARSGANFAFAFAPKDAGISDDGQGTYTHGVDGVESSLQNGGARLYPWVPSSGTERRTLLVDLSRPVDPLTQTAYGRIQRADSNFRVHWRTDNAAKTIYSILDIPVGTTVTSERVEASVMIDGRQHVLWFGTLDLAVCWNAGGVHGRGTSAATVTRTSPTEWLVDLPVGSKGRLWDLRSRPTETTALLGRTTDTPTEPVDRGLYFLDTSVVIKRL